jgi:hypothetical protein
MKQKLEAACAALEARHDAEKSKWDKLDIKGASDKAKVQSSLTQIGEEVMSVWRSADKEEKAELSARLNALLLSIQSELRAKGFYRAQGS